MKSMYKDHLLNECFDIDDLVRWVKTQMDNTDRQDHLEIYTKFCMLLEKIKENEIKSYYKDSFGRDRKIDLTCQVDST